MAHGVVYSNLVRNRMKKFAGSLLFLISLMGCGAEKSDNYDSVVAINKYLQEKIKEKDQELEAITNTMAHIENNLATIRKKEGAIETLTRNKASSVAEQIEEMLSEIGAYLEENKQMVTELDEKLRKNGSPEQGFGEPAGPAKASRRWKRSRRSDN